MSEEKHSSKKELITIQDPIQKNNSASPPDSKNQDLSKKLEIAANYATLGQPAPFEKFILEPFNTNEKSFWAFMQSYLSTTIEKRIAHSFYDFENLVHK